MQYSVVMAKNRPSPSNEDEYVAAYKVLVPQATRSDLYDIACVTTYSGINGHAMMYYSDNRSHDNSYHRCINFVSDDELRRHM